MPRLLTQFEFPAVLGLLAVLPFFTFLTFLKRRRNRFAMAVFANASTLTADGKPGRSGDVLRSICFALGAALLVVGTAGPRWGSAEETTGLPGRDLVVVLDLSRSMLAQDVLPNRLGRAQQALVELAKSLHQRGGHRLALVTFAAAARIDCPLTYDHSHFQTVVSDLDGTAPHPDLRPAGKAFSSGTRLGAGLQTALKLLDRRYRSAQDILLISDGDDPAADEDWHSAVQEAAQSGIRIHTLGLGDPQRESRIPGGKGQVLRYQQREVTTRLNERPLQMIARRTGGDYLAARTQSVDLPTWFRRLAEAGPSREAVQASQSLPPSRSSWFLIPALSLLSLEAVWDWGRRRGQGKP